jgi:hypothetical protein
MAKQTVSAFPAVILDDEVMFWFSAIDDVGKPIDGLSLLCTRPSRLRSFSVIRR